MTPKKSEILFKLYINWCAKSGQPIKIHRKSEKKWKNAEKNENGDGANGCEEYTKIKMKWKWNIYICNTF